MEIIIQSIIIIGLGIVSIGVVMSAMAGIMATIITVRNSFNYLVGNVKK